MFILYESDMYGEVIVCTPEAEEQVLKEYFDPDTGRDLEDFDRHEIKSAVQLTSKTQVWEM